jgi:hypothetical protein
MSLLDVCLVSLAGLVGVALLTLCVGSLLLSLLAGVLGFSLPLWMQALGGLTAIAVFWAGAMQLAQPPA